MAAAEIPLPDSAPPQNLVFVDLETTGGNPAFHRVTEVGIVRMENGAIVDEWSSLVNPECEIPPYIAHFTGISNEMVADAPRFAQIASTVLEKLRGATFVAHNARFDYSFLRSEFLKSDLAFSAQVLCTVKLSRRLFPQHARHNLDAVMQRHDLTCTARHRALGDAQVLRDFWFKLLHELSAPVLGQAVLQALLAEPKLPPHLPRGLSDQLPEGPGVYRFFGEGDELLYVGRSHSLRTRILAQLDVEHASVRDAQLAAQVRRVDWCRTAGELGALLREARWIRTHRPPFNRRLKGAHEAVTLRPAADDSGRIEMPPIDSLDAQALEQSFGVFNSQKDARKALLDIARAKQLCLKAMGLEQGEGSCVGFQLGHCKGVCAGKEAHALHQMRMLLALSSLKIKTWPFPGRIGLRDAPGAELHVLEHWSYLGSADNEDDLIQLREHRVGNAFDPDVYRILLRFLSNHPRAEWVNLS